MIFVPFPLITTKLSIQFLISLLLKSSWTSILTYLLLLGLLAYLCDRSQCVVINGDASGLVQVVSGVPQGSVLGPLCFVSTLIVLH